MAFGTLRGVLLPVAWLERPVGWSVRLRRNRHLGDETQGCKSASIIRRLSLDTGIFTIDSTEWYQVIVRQPVRLRASSHERMVSQLVEAHLQNDRPQRGELPR
jgi:hypothetical protein